MKHKFVVIYGANNLGKTTQVDLLVDRLTSEGLSPVKLKYPIYDLEPTGPIINAALREGLVISNLDLQKQFAQNRRDFESQLVQLLTEGHWVVAEDYKGTGIAWGVTNDISLEVMEEINAGLLEEGLAILLDGERFVSGIERGHRHEVNRDWEKARRDHLMLAERYGWEVVDANGRREEVAQEIWKRVLAASFVS